ncbi:oligosaccharide biosynthesis protein Alg14-like protein [Catenaria anguillulae PL171]|uniref:UDP-N-acetylglucosamine transferase subunit ALG14 n=1 Tax=Catenaria anguillulae PL171 TaxID=765915 RepID=A0A1Y2HJY3_9FUNG|nr:oligosaccharide biosynthesis protein Alg14-like protein [Catenaria anguillulae PL171]
MLIVLGSGGHTMEMLQLLSTLGPQSPYPRSYVVARGDPASLAKITQFELERADQDHYRVHAIPRARQVGQAYWSAVWSSARAGLSALWIVFSDAPLLLLCNGPGTCLPLCLSVALFKVLGLLHTRQLYVESVARVQTLSLTGKIYYHLRLGDMVVQWPSLAKRYPRVKYNGLLV